MRVANTWVYNKKVDFESQVRTLQENINKIFQCLQGRISFGTGDDGQRNGNVEGEWQEFTSHAGADTEFAVAHGLISVPLGYLVVSQDKAGTLYQMHDTGTAWTTTNIYLKCNVASVRFLIFLIKKGPTS
jgi:hypothetical protein